MHPILFDLPWGPAHAYGTLILCGGIVCIPGLHWDARSRNIASNRRLSFLVDYYLVLVFGAFVGGRILHLLTRPDAWNPALWSSSAALSDGGFVFFGSLLAILVGWIWLARRYDTAFATLCDLGSTWIPLGHAFGRLGCWFAGCCWGAPTTHAWGVRFPETAIATLSGEVPVEGGHTVPLVPVQLLEAASLIALFGVLLALRRRRGPQEPSWRASARYGIGYGVIRLLTEVLRGDDSRGWLWTWRIPPISQGFGLPVDQPVAVSISQAVAIAMIVAGTAVLCMRSPAR